MDLSVKQVFQESFFMPFKFGVGKLLIYMIQEWNVSFCVLITFFIWSDDFFVILASSDVFISCGYYTSKVGPPDFKLHSEMILLKNFVSNNAKGNSSLPKLHDALWESMAERDMGGIFQPRNKANHT